MMIDWTVVLLFLVSIMNIFMYVITGDQAQKNAVCRKICDMEKYPPFRKIRPKFGLASFLMLGISLVLISINLMWPRP